MKNKHRQENIQRILEGKKPKYVDHGENIPLWFKVAALIIGAILASTKF